MIRCDASRPSARLTHRGLNGAGDESASWGVTFKFESRT
jgi:hypothetical protein